MADLKLIDKSWTLFLDRDGVINDERHMNYINHWEEFKFYPKVQDAIKIFSEKFGRIFIVTNQRGIAKGLTKLENLQEIHTNLITEVEATGGKIDKIYFCGDMDNTSPNRKPNTGMGLEAKQDFPEVDFAKSVMIGNTITDMEFGRNLGVAINIFLPTTHPHIKVQHPMIDMVYPDLYTVSKAL